MAEDSGLNLSGAKALLEDNEPTLNLEGAKQLLDSPKQATSPNGAGSGVKESIAPQVSTSISVSETIPSELGKTKAIPITTTYKDKIKDYLNKTNFEPISEQPLKTATKDVKEIIKSGNRKKFEQGLTNKNNILNQEPQADEITQQKEYAELGNAIIEHKAKEQEKQLAFEEKRKQIDNADGYLRTYPKDLLLASEDERNKEADALIHQYGLNEDEAKQSIEKRDNQILENKATKTENELWDNISEKLQKDTGIKPSEENIDNVYMANARVTALSDMDENQRLAYPKTLELNKLLEDVHTKSDPLKEVKIATLKKEIAELTNNKKMWFDPITGKSIGTPTEETKGFANKVKQDATNLAIKNTKADLENIFRKSYAKYQYAKNLYDEHQQSLTAPLLGNADELHNTDIESAKRIKDIYVKSKAEFDAISQAYLLNRDVSGVERSPLKLAGEAFVKEIVPSSLTPKGLLNNTNEAFVRNIQTLANDNKLDLTKEQEDRFKHTFTENVAEGVGGVAGMLPKLWIAGEVVGVGEAITGLQKGIQILSKGDKVERGIAILAKGAIEEAKMQGVGFNAGVGAGFSMSNGIKSPKLGGKYGAILQPFVDKIVKSSVGATAGMELGEITATAVDALNDRTDFGEKMQEMFPNVSEVGKRVLQNLIVNAVIGIPHLSKTDFTFSADKLKEVSNELYSKGYREEAEQVKQKADQIRGYDVDTNAEIDKKIAKGGIVNTEQRPTNIGAPIKFTSPTNDLYGYVEENGVKRNLTKEEFDNYEKPKVSIKDQLDKLSEDKHDKIFKVIPSDFRLTVGDFNGSIEKLYNQSKKDGTNQDFVNEVEAQLGIKENGNRVVEQQLESPSAENGGGVDAGSEEKVQGGEEGVQKVEVFNNKKTGVSGVDDLLNDDGYQYFYKGVTADVTEMTPDEYLAKVREGMKSDVDENISDEKKNAIKEAISKGNKINMPYLSYKNGRFNQEGRNRAVVAKEMGIEKIPVLIEKDVTFDDKINRGKEYVNEAIKEGAKNEEQVIEYLENKDIHRDAIRFIEDNYADLTPKAPTSEVAEPQMQSPIIAVEPISENKETVIGKVYKDSFNRTFEIKSENAGILTLVDVETGKILRKKKSEVLSDFKEVVEENANNNANIIIEHLPKGGDLKGITEIKVSENGESVEYGTKNNKVKVSVKGMDANAIKDEIAFEKKILERSKRDAESFNENEIKSMRGMTDKEKEIAIKMHKQSLLLNEQTEKIVIPFYEKHLELKEATPNTEDNAPKIESPAEVLVGEQPKSSKGVPSGNTQEQKVAEQGKQEEVKPKTIKKEVKVTPRQEKINTLVEKIKYYNNQLGKGKGNGSKQGRLSAEGTELLRQIHNNAKELGLYIFPKSANDQAVIKYSEKGGVIRATYGGNKIGVENHIPLEERSKSTQELFHTLNNAGLNHFPIIRNFDGRKFTDNQVKEAVSDVVNGHNSLLADRLLSELDKAVTKGGVELFTGATTTDVELKDFLKFVSEQQENGVDYFSADYEPTNEEALDLANQYDEYLKTLPEEELNNENKIIKDEIRSNEQSGSDGESKTNDRNKEGEGLSGVESEPKEKQELLTPNNKQDGKDENGIQEGGKARVENVPEAVQGNGEKGGQDVNKQEKVNEPQPKPVSKESGKKEKLTKKQKDLEQKEADIWAEFEKRKLEGKLKGIKRQGGGITDAHVELAIRLASVQAEKIANKIKQGILATEEIIQKVADFFETKFSDREQEELAKAINNESTALRGFRKDVLSEVQNTFKNASKSFQQLVSDGLSQLRVKKGESIFDATGRVANNFIKKLNAKEKIVLNTAETAQLQYYHTALRKEAFDIANKYEGIQKELYLAPIEAQIAEMEKIWGAAGQEQARAFAMRQLEMSMSPKKVLDMKRMEFYRKSKVDSNKLSPEQIDKQNIIIDKLIEERDAREKELVDKYEKALKEEAEKHIEKTKQGGVSVDKPRQSFVERASKKLKDNPKLREIFNNKDRSQDIIEKVDKGRKEGKSIDEIVDELVGNKEISEGNAPKVKKFFREQEVEMAKEAGKIDNDMLREIVQKIIDSGVDRKDIGIDEIVSRLKEDYFTDFTDKQIRDMITDYGKTKVLNKDPIASTIEYAKKVGILLSRIEELKQEILPKKKLEVKVELSEKEIAAKKAEISGLQKQVNGLMKNLPIDEATKANQLKTAQDRIGSFLENSILQLEKQIAEGVKTAINKKTVVYNEANKVLLEKLNAVRAEFNNKFPKAEISIEERTRRAVKGIEKSERNYESRIAEGRFENEPKTTLTSPEIEIAKAKRDLRKAEFEKLKAESVPLVDAKAELLGDISEMAEKQGATTFTNEMVKEGYVDKLVKQKIEEGLKGEEVFKQIKEDLKDILPDLTESEIHKAVLKVDEFKQPIKAEIENETNKQTKVVKEVAKLKQDIADIENFGKVIRETKNITPKVVSSEIKKLQEKKKSILDAIKQKEKELKNYIAKQDRALANNEAYETSHEKKKQKYRDDIAELERKISIANNEIFLWGKAIKEPKRVDSQIAEKRKQLREALVKNGYSLESENVTNRKRLLEIGKSANKLIDTFRENINKKLDAVKGTPNEVLINNAVKGLDKIEKFNYNTAESKAAQLRKVKLELADIAKKVSGHDADLASEANRIIEDINKQLDLALEAKATESFIANTQRHIDKNVREMAQGKFETIQRATPKLDAQIIEMMRAKNESDRKFRMAQERFEAANKNNFLDTYYFATRREGLISGLTTLLSKLPIASFARPKFETLRNVVLGGIVDKTIMRRMRHLYENEGTYLDSIRAAHSDLWHPFRNEKDVLKDKVKIEKDFESAVDDYEKDKTDENKAKMKLAQERFVYTKHIFDFIGANSHQEFLQMAAANMIQIEKAFALDKGMKRNEVENFRERYLLEIGIFSRLHGGIKNYSGRSSFMRAFVNNIKNASNRGEDISNVNNVAIYALNSLKAYKEGTYQNDNFVIETINRTIQNLKTSEKKGILMTDKLQGEVMSTIYKALYPIVKTPMNIWKEATVDYTLGLIIGGRSHYKIKKEIYKDVAKVMQSDSFSAKMDEVNKRMGQLDGKTVDELRQLYTKGGFGALMIFAALKGLISKDDNDEWTLFGIHLGKESSKAISHLSAIMPAEAVVIYDDAKEKAEKAGSENPSLDGAKAVVSYYKEQNVYGRDYKANANSVVSSFIPHPKFAGDINKMYTDTVYRPKTIGEILGYESLGITKGLSVKGSYSDKHKVTTEDLSHPKVISFQKTDTYKNIPDTYKEEATAIYAEKVKAIEGYKDIKPTDKAIEYKEALDNVKEAIDKKIKHDKFIKELDKAETEKDKVAVFKNALIDKSKGRTDSRGHKQITHKDFSAREKQYKVWEKEGILTPEIKKVLESELEN